MPATTETPPPVRHMDAVYRAARALVTAKRDAKRWRDKACHVLPGHLAKRVRDAEAALERLAAAAREAR